MIKVPALFGPVKSANPVLESGLWPFVSCLAMPGQLRNLPCRPGGTRVGDGFGASPPLSSLFLAHNPGMTLTTTAIGLLALAAQLGVPVQERAGEAAAGTPLGSPLGERPVAERVAPEVSGFFLSGSAVGVPEGGAAVAGIARPSFAVLPAADRAWVEDVLGSLTVREKVAQLVVAYIEGGRPSHGGARWRRAERLVREQEIGGFIVGVGSSYGTASWLNELQAASNLPLLVAADLEWGPGTRLRGATVLPINMAVAAAGASRMAYEAGRITALEARAAGIHLAFAPVADVNINPDNPVINTRSYGSDPSEVADRVVEFIRGAREAGLMTVVKHFPGHGDTETDSHLAMPVLGVDRDRLAEVELAPFRSAIAAGVDGVMTAHLAVPALDPRPRLRPATLSPPILTGLLREELGFSGLVVTDALHMDGVMEHGRAGEVAVAAVQAGADILLIPPDEEAAIDALVEAVEQGEVSEARIDASVRRVLSAKAAAGLREDRSVHMGQVLSQIGRAEHDEWSRHTAERSLTLVRSEPGALPLAIEERRLVMVVYDDRSGHRSGRVLESRLIQHGGTLTTVRLSEESDDEDLARASRLLDHADIRIFASFSRALPWKGELGLPEGVAAVAEEAAAAGGTLISFGDPYLLRQIPSARTYLIAWSEADVMQEAVARALTGEIPITGRLPIDLPEGHSVGEGLVLPVLPIVTTLRP